MENTISKLTFDSMTMIADYSYNLKLEFLQEGLKIYIKGCWYEFELKTENNKEFISSLIESLENLKLEDWKKDYNVMDTGIFVTDLQNWKLNITYSNGEVKESKGYGAYPNNWKDFEKVIERLVPLATIKSFWK